MKILTKEESAPLEENLSKFFSQQNVSFSPKDDIFEFCKSLGFKVWKIPLDEEELDGIILAKGRDKRIGLNKSLELEDARFVLAHELSHYITEAISTAPREILVAERDRIFHGNDKKPEEDHMDYMAAALLVPQELFMEDLKKLNIKLKQFKNKTVEYVREKISDSIIEYLSLKYCVNEEVILRRVLEVSYYD